ncbi:MAG: acetyl ornithine aminotransferase family protein, partial [Chloroflexi bacterium]|nr:acetyl ornithine aminotransferase family protein [Chloroflexota bacterium]
MSRKLSVPGPKAKAILRRDAATISPSYPRDVPFVMSHGRGSEVWDVDGNRYIDLAAGIAVCATGHSHPAVVRAIQQQAQEFIHISSDFYHPRMVELAERLDEIAPFKEDALCFLTNSGTETVEAAIKLARWHTGRSRFIGFLGGFHGRTMGALAFTASKSVQRAGFFPMMGGVTHVPFPDPYRPILNFNGGNGGSRDYGDTVVDYIENILFASALPPDDVAAILVEPIQGEGGYVVPPDHFFPRLRGLCDKHGILLIADEVQSGMGRTGKWWAIEHWGVEPDIVCIAKGIASGMPLGAMVARKSVMDWPMGAHGNTYGGNPISCAAALATIHLIESGLMDNAATMGEHIVDALTEIQPRHASIGHIRGKGLMIGVELVADKKTKEPAKALRDRLIEHAFERGLLLLGCGQSVVRIAPPLNIERTLVDEALGIFEEALTEAKAETP